MNCKVDLQAYSAVDGAGCTAAYDGYVSINGVRVWSAQWCPSNFSLNKRGVNTLLLDPLTCSVGDVRQFDTFLSASNADDLSAYIQYLGAKNGKNVVLIGVTGDEPTKNLATARRTLRTAGLRIDDVQYRGSFAFVIYPGQPQRTIFAKTVKNTVSPNTKLSVTVTGNSIVISRSSTSQ